MPIEVTCPECAATLTVGNDKAGLRVRCRDCGTVVAVPNVSRSALDADRAKTGAKSKTSPLKPLIRPAIYAFVGLFALLALSFRWWFNPPLPPPPAAPDLEAMMSRDQAADPTREKVQSDAWMAQQAKYTRIDARNELYKNGATWKFISHVRVLINESPELQLSTEPNQVVWNKFTLAEDGVGLNVFRFQSPLEEPGDFYWCFSSPTVVESWYILPVHGSMTGFQDYRAVANSGFEGLDLPPKSIVIAQQLLGGEIKPGMIYLVYFTTSSKEPQPLRVAARVAPHEDTVAAEPYEEHVLQTLGLRRIAQD
jgi:predicted Zn finger-like uncharacterized protein